MLFLLDYLLGGKKSYRIIFIRQIYIIIHWDSDLNSINLYAFYSFTKLFIS